MKILMISYSPELCHLKRPNSVQFIGYREVVERVLAPVDI